MLRQVQDLIEKIGLLPHPEGGFYKEIYRSQGIIPQQVLGENFSGNRNFCTSIYFLLMSDGFSAFHRIKQDEIWHFYDGSPLFIHVIEPNGNYMKHELGIDLDKGQAPQLVIPAGCWFASHVKEGNSYTLAGCTVAPGFDFDDFELAEREKLIDEFPRHSEIISQLTRNQKT